MSPDDSALRRSPTPAAPAATSTPSPADIDGFLAWTLVRLGHGVERVLTDSIAEHGLTSRQFGVLSLLAAHAEDDLTQSDLARAVLVRVQSMGPLIASLMQRGLITRRGPGGRGRRTTFDLTDDGRHLLDQAWTRVTARNGPTSLGLDEHEAGTLAALLERVLAAIGQPGAVRADRG